MTLLSPLTRVHPVNLFATTEELTGFTATRCTVTEDAEADPFGDTEAASVIEDATAASTHVLTRAMGAALITGRLYTLSCFAKTAGTRNARLFLGNGGATFDLGTGATANVTAGVRPYAFDMGDGWWRVAITFLIANTNLSIFIASGTSTSYDGGGTDGIYLTGLVLHAGELTNYVPID